jgi:uncharacterized protein YggE
VVPDEAEFTIATQVFDKDASRAKAENQRRMSAVLGILKSAGVDPKDMQTEGMELTTRYKKDNDTKEIVGFVAEDKVNVKLRDLAKAEEIMRQSIAAGATSISSLDYKSSKILEHRRTARKMALEAARAKAEEMAGVLGAKLGKVLLISENIALGGGGRANSSFAYNAYNQYSNDEPKAAAGMISVNEQVMVSFELQ